MKQSDPKTRRMAPLQTPTDLGSQATKDLPAALDLLLAEVQREAILRALHSSNGIIGGSQGAAALLGLKRTTLQSRMQKLGIAPLRPTARRTTALPTAPDTQQDLPIGKFWRRLLLQAIKSNELRASLPLGGLSRHSSLVPDALEERA